VYQVKAKPTSVKNPQANLVLECINQVQPNMLRTFRLESNINENDPWTGILSAVGWAIQSTFHTTLRATPGQLVFACDMVFNTEKLIKFNNNREIKNKKNVKHTYHVGDMVLVQCTDSAQKTVQRTILNH